MADNVTQTYTSQPWSAQQPYLTYGFGEAQSLYGLGGPQYYGSSTVAPMSGSTQQALTNMENYSNANPYLMAGRPLMQDTLAGNFLNPASNPYLTDTYNMGARSVTDTFNNSVLPNISANFGLAGRSGSGLFANAVGQATNSLGTSLSDLATKVYGGAYEAERGRQMQALGMVPGMSTAQFDSIGQGLKAGQLRDAQAQAELTDQVNRFQFNQMRPYDNLARYMSTIQGNYGSSGTQTSPSYSQPGWATGLGLGLLGLDLFT